MRIIFFGATKYSEDLLKELLRNKYEIAAIFTLPRKFRISYSTSAIEICNYADLRKISKEYKIPIIELSGKFNKYVDRIKKFSPDIILVLGWYHLLPKAVRQIPKKGCIGIHASLLPKYAGGAPLTWALINGERKSGVTLFYLDKGVDTGDIIARTAFPIAYNDDISILYKKATRASIKILLDYLPRISKGNAPRKKQDMRQRTYFPQRRPSDGKIDWSKPAEQIRNFIRAQTRPYPGAYFLLRRSKIKIWKARVVKSGMQKTSIPGRVFSVRRNYFDVDTKAGRLRVTDCVFKTVMEIMRSNYKHELILN